MGERTPTNPPAFPGLEIPAGGLPGMTLRDYFAAAALQGYCASSAMSCEENHKLAEWSYETADAMLKARQE